MSTTHADGRAAGYSGGRTLPFRTELRRQLGRRRTQLAIGFLALLPVILVVAFTVGSSSADSDAGGLIELGTRGGMNFTVFALFMSVGFLLIVVVALFFGDSVASEASWSSLRYLLAIPVPRSRLLTQKALVSATLSSAAILVLVGVSLLIGTVMYGAESLVTPLGEGLSYGTSLVRLLIAVAYIGINLLWVAGLAMLLSVLTDAPLGAVGGAVMTSILMQILDQITALGSLRNYLPGHYANSWIDAFGTNIDWNDMVVGSFSAITYAAVFGLIAWRRFATKDITS
ncbi:ABC transporter permease [Rhodococcoides fascians]|jgi:ABC-2 type transport system permease protein|uniref:ABC transporter permease n=1 Tax=Nocardiaceae TaxID=85025 RepID=UPI00050C9258|nr:MULTISPECIES: ABC transporter permease subunit [Rhodococcus]MBJ7350440.1 ABC transporter permease subunit [Rhodococcus sp. (in: high G+C Gram-positive bacteria)]MBW4780565.1 ABC transporter permease [Rhodococcus fascians]MBY4209592.1 ABC transporter permease subunit [Rhodococcus fascians]MDJ0428750.1 ABC transporter permease subunit [Rhodococcus fascians]MDJ0471220.1 ABC transporter permease subunit [Rhodococcus fascians]